MKVYLSGGEKGSHRSLLTTAGASHIAINLTHLAIPKRKEFLLPQVFPSASGLAVYTSEGDEDTNRYDEFIRTYADGLDVIIGRPEYNGDWLGDKYIPIWSDDQDLERLAWLCQKGRVAISDRAINAKTLPRIKSLTQRWGTRLVGLTSKPDVIAALPWDTVIVGSWTSAIRYGETQVWDGHALRRYPAQNKESARRKHRADIVRLGVDFDAVMEDEVQAVGLLAIKSWQAWENKEMAYDPPSDQDEDEFSTSPDSDVVAQNTVTDVTLSPAFGGSTITPTPLKKRHANERVLLPVIGIEDVVSMGSKTHDEQGESIEIDPETVPLLRYSGDPLRQCDSCYLSARCPAFQEHSECGFKLPVTIRTKDQLQAALRVLLELQVSRVLFARFAEELEGQGLDPALSKEIDRVFTLVEKFRNINDSRELVRMEIETRSGGGVLSRIFGSRAGEVVRQLPGGPVEEHDFDRLALDIIDMDE